MSSNQRPVLRPQRWGRGTAMVAAVLMAIVGFSMIAVDSLGQPSLPPMPVATTPPPQPEAMPIASEGVRSTPSASPTSPASVSPTSSSPTSPPAGPSTPVLSSRSAPKRVDIPSIGVSAPVGGVGRASNGAIGVPPANKPHLAGWYKFGATPGQPGRTVIVGHLDSRYSGRAVFYNLGSVRRGETVTVTRRDGIEVVYRVDGASIQPKDRFPAEQIYAPSGRSELRLITCGGRFDKKAGWSDNIIVYAHMVSWYRTPTTGWESQRADVPRG